MNRDPIGYEGGDINLYGYVGAIPTYYADPSGLYRPDQSAPWPTGCGRPVGGTLQDYDAWRKSCGPRPEPPAPRRNPCDGYNAFIGTTCLRESCSGQSSFVPDNYPANAKKICNNFLKLYGNSSTVRCVADCLVKEEAKTIIFLSCSARNGERIDNHFWCYFSCGFIPYRGLPEGADDVGWNDLLPDYLDSFLETY